VKTTIEMELVPFDVPSTVTKAEQIGPDDKHFSLSEIPANTLSAMCDEFRDEIFRKANKLQPPREMPRPHDHKSPRCWCGEANYGASQATSGVES